MYCIYFIVNRTTDRVYIGQSIEPKGRVRAHRLMLKKGVHPNYHLQNSWNEYGAGVFDYYVLCEFQTKAEVDDAEVFYIRWFQDLDLCFNARGGGDGCPDPTPETREKMSVAKRGKKQDPEHIKNRAEAMAEAWKVRGVSEADREQRRKQNLGNSNFAGKKHTDETLQKMSENRLGEKNPQFGKPTSDKQKQAASATWKGVKRGPMSEETKQKLREARAKQVMKPVSEETKEKIRQAKLARDRLKGG